MAGRKLDILILCVLARGSAGALCDHVSAFRRYSRNHVTILPNFPAMYGSMGGRIPTLPRGIDLEAFDVLVIHYSNFLLSDDHFDAEARERISAFRGLKVLFLQDEYRKVDAVTAEIRNLRIDVLFTIVPEKEVENVYPDSVLPGVSKIYNLTGYVSETLARRKPVALAGRPLDVGYRARRLPFWYGRLSTEKWLIAESFLEASRESGLKLDISCREEDRIYGRQWIHFIESCRAMLGVESGTSVVDFTGELERKTEEYVTAHPDATFDEVQERCLRSYDGKIVLNIISPRCFEAAALRTAMVLYEGYYSGILEPERHYVPLRKDFSNFDEVLKVLRDTPAVEKMIERAHREIVASGKYSYRAFVDQFDQTVEREAIDRGIIEQSDRGLAAAGARNLGRSPASTKSGKRDGRFVKHVRTRLSILKLKVLESVVVDLLRKVVRPTYHRLVPESIRDKLRPLIRRIVANDVA